MSEEIKLGACFNTGREEKVKKICNVIYLFFTAEDSEEGTDFGQSSFGHPDLTNLGQSNFGQSNFGQSNLGQSNLGQSISGSIPEKSGPEGWGQKGWGAEGWVPKSGAPEGWGGPKFRAFFPLLPPFRSFFVWGPKGGGPEGWGSRRVGPPMDWGPEGWVAQGQGLRRVGSPKSRAFFPSKTTSFALFSLIVCLLVVFFGGVWKRRGRQVRTFGEPKRVHLRVPVFTKTTKI